MTDAGTGLRIMSTSLTAAYYSYATRSVLCRSARAVKTSLGPVSVKFIRNPTRADVVMTYLHKLVDDFTQKLG